MLDFPRPPFPKHFSRCPARPTRWILFPIMGKIPTMAAEGSTVRRPSSPAGIAASAARSPRLAREGADVLISYLNEDDDARETQRLVRKPVGKQFLCPVIFRTPPLPLNHREGDVGSGRNRHPHQQCGPPGHLQVNRRHQDDEWELTFKVNIHAMFYLTKAAITHMKPASRSSTPRRSIPTHRTRRCLPTQRPRERSTISLQDWLSCWPTRASAPTRSRRDRSGRHSSLQHCPTTPSQFRQAGSDEAARAADGVGHRLCHAG